MTKNNKKQKKIKEINRLSNKTCNNNIIKMAKINKKIIFLIRIKCSIILNNSKTTQSLITLIEMVQKTHFIGKDKMI